MARGFKRIAALMTVFAVLFAFAACGNGKGPDKDTGLTKAEEARVIEMARTFRIFGEYSSENAFELSQYEYMIYSLFTWSLEECDVRGYGRVSTADADAAFASVIGPITIGNMRRTQYKPNEIQVIYVIGEYYYVQLTDDSAYTYSVDYARLLTDEAGERVGVSAAVRVEGKDGDFALAFEFADARNTLAVRKCQIQSYE